MLTVGFSACSIKKTLPYTTTVPDSIKRIAIELQKDMGGSKNDAIVFTSLVDLNDFKESSNFGRLFSESLMTELSRRGFKVIEYRGDAVVTKIKKGEFKLNRARIQDIEDKNTLVLVGTYSKINDYIIVNVRIVEKDTGVLVAAASTYSPVHKAKNKFSIQLVPSSCGNSDYCWKDLNE